MPLATSSTIKDLVLVGGGHSHAIALWLFGMNPLPGVRLTLLTPTSTTPYSGMIPGHVAGFYQRAECHIDLLPLCKFAGSQFECDRAIGLDLENQLIVCAHRPPIRFDLLSIDIGSTPKIPFDISDCDRVIPAKPVDQFLHRWAEIIERVTQNPHHPISLAIVGGGAGGVELALTMHHRLQSVLQSAGQPPDRLTIHLLQRDATLLPKHNRWVRHHLHQLLTQRGVAVHLQTNVIRVDRDRIQCESGTLVQADHIIWVTQASAPDWLRQCGLAVDEDGFVLVDDCLRSLSHPQVFAAGDIATMIHHPRPKAGVFAVRQGKPLFHNLQRVLQGKPPKPFYPQKHYLSLIGTGDGAAIASNGPFGWHSRLLWRWKDAIDRQFMAQFQHLPGISHD